MAEEETKVENPAENPEEDPTENPTENPIGKKTKTLYIWGFGKDVDQETVKEEFARYATIQRVTIIRDKATGLSKGFGYVECESPEEAAKAKNEMDGKLIGENPVKIKFSHSETPDWLKYLDSKGKMGERPSRGGFRGRGRGRGNFREPGNYREPGFRMDRGVRGEAGEDHGLDRDFSQRREEHYSYGQTPDRGNLRDERRPLTDPYEKRPLDPYESRGLADPYERRPLADPYERRPLADPYEKRPLADPYEKRPLADPYEKRPLADPYEERLVDPYESRRRIADIYGKRPLVDPYEKRPLVDPYERRPLADPYEKRPLESRRVADPYESRHLANPYERRPPADPYERRPLADPSSALVPGRSSIDAPYNERHLPPRREAVSDDPYYSRGRDIYGVKRREIMEDRKDLYRPSDYREIDHLQCIPPGEMARSRSPIDRSSSAVIRDPYERDLDERSPINRSVRAERIPAEIPSSNGSSHINNYGANRDPYAPPYSPSYAPSYSSGKGYPSDNRNLDGRYADARSRSGYELPQKPAGAPEILKEIS